MAVITVNVLTILLDTTFFVKCMLPVIIGSQQHLESTTCSRGIHPNMWRENCDGYKYCQPDDARLTDKGLELVVEYFRKMGLYVNNDGAFEWHTRQEGLSLTEFIVYLIACQLPNAFRDVKETDSQKKFPFTIAL